MSNKYEQLVEFIINDETDKARELFHQIVVEKSRDIYENLVSEEDLDEVGGNQVEDMVQDVQMDEEGISEEEEGEDDMSMDADAMDADEMSGEEHEEAEIEDRVVDLESALDELKAEFDALMAGEEHEEHEMPGIHGDEGAEEQSEFFESDEEVAEESEEVEESEEKEVVKEYVEKVADTGAKSESGKEAGAHGSANVNKTTPVAGKNDMGGSSSNIATGKANPSPDGTSPKATAKTKGELIGKVLNTPGADAGKAFAKKETAVKAEVGGVNKTTPVAK